MDANASRTGSTDWSARCISPVFVIRKSQVHDAVGYLVVSLYLIKKKEKERRKKKSTNIKGTCKKS